MAAALFESSQGESDGRGLNAIAAERRKLDAFADSRGSGKRGKITVGIIGTLSSYGYLPLWHTLFTALGYGVTVPHLDRLNAFTAQATATITSEYLCAPAKSAHGRIFEMIDRGVDALFAPRYQPTSLCAVLCNYSDVIANNIPAVIDGSVGVIAPSLEDVKLQSFYDDPDKFIPVLEAIRAFDTASAPTDDEFRTVLDKALQVQRTFDTESALLHRKAVDELFHNAGKHAIIVAGRPYQLAPDQLKGIDAKLAARGYTVLSPLAIRISLRQIPPPTQEDPTSNQDLFLRWIAEGAVDEPSLNVVFLKTADCGYDAVSIAEAQRILAEGNRRCAVIDIDGTADEINSQVEAAVKDFENERAYRKLEDSDTLSPAQAIEFLMDSYKGQSLRIDAQKRLSDLPDSLCNTVAALFRGSLDSFADDPDLDEVHLPAVCKGCLVEKLPSLLSHSMGRNVEVVWDDHWIDAPNSLTMDLLRREAFPQPEADIAAPIPLHERQAREPYSLPADFTPTIGLAGNPLLCFNQSVVETLSELAQQNGARLLPPDPSNFHPEDGYGSQLEAYGNQGVDGVFCLQDTHCLKEHVNIRGSLASLQRKFPSMQLVAIDVCDGASSINLGNRVSLAVCRILDRKQEEYRATEGKLA